MESEKIFKSENGLELLISSSKTSIVFNINNQDESIKEIFTFRFKFSDETFEEIIKYLYNLAKNQWPDLEPKEATSMSSDFDEYYDRKLDSNGYFSLKKNEFIIDRPSLSSRKLFQFNKRKMESLLFSLNQI